MQRDMAGLDMNGGKVALTCDLTCFQYGARKKSFSGGTLMPLSPSDRRTAGTGWVGHEWRKSCVDL
jgi:hypothetical protein